MRDVMPEETPRANFSGRAAIAAAGLRGRLIENLLVSFNCCLLAMLLVVAVEWIARGAFQGVPEFVVSTSRAGPATVALVALMLFAGDAILGAAYRSLLLIAPVVLLLAFFSAQKQLFLSDPLYPSDLLFARQILELLPVIVDARPLAALGIGVVFLLAIGILAYAVLFAWTRFPKLNTRGRLLRLAIAVPLLASCIPLAQYDRYSWIRDRLSILPMMWDQNANYRHNGFLIALAFNLPMLKVAAPSGYRADAIADVPLAADAFAVDRSERPDVIMIMSESLWDPTRLPGVHLEPDPMPTIRAHQSGNVFSPEFGGMTANVEFEALTGFSNAFLPQGSIPYQQYIRRPLPSLASFFRGEGYRSIAIHPFEGWFWNRTNVYKALGFDEFLAQADLPELEKHGKFAADEALMRQIMVKGEASDQPFFLFAVTLQGHGPYESDRYGALRTEIESGLSERALQSFATYVEGVRQADNSLASLMHWARARERETIVILFGDHLPPLGPTFQESGYMRDMVATRRAELDVMKREHETPLVVWSSRTGVVTGLGSISPAQLPYHAVKGAGFRDPFYTGVLGEVRKNYSIVDRYMLGLRDGGSKPGWLDGGALPQALSDYRLLQYDMMFGAEYARERFFPGFDWLLRQGMESRKEGEAIGATS
nr:LTA synthase family protein [Rhizobium sp. LCM 4573]